MTLERPTGTVAFLFTDIQGSTRLVEALGTAAWLPVLARHRAIVRAAIAAHGGSEAATEGDSFFVAFSDPLAAVAMAADAQRGLAAEPWPDGAEIRVRMGIHVGHGELDEDGTYVGHDVHRAARVEAAAHGGQVLLSEAALDAVAGRLPDGLSTRSLGSHRLKDLRPERISQLLVDGLPDEFPAIRSLDARPNNLPTQLTAFVGRDRELVDVRALLDDARLVTLTGPGGTGKTRLALQVAAAASDAFADGIWFVPLAPILDPALVPSAIASAVGLTEQPGRSSLDILADELGGRAVLLVLDNLEHVSAAVPGIGELLRRTQRLRILATSRAPLRVAGEQEFPVAGLPAPVDIDRLSALERERLPDAVRRRDPETIAGFEAVRLFLARARAVRPGFELTAATSGDVAAIVDHLGGVPLAIELAAARMRFLTPAAIHERLEGRLDLPGGGAADAPERQRSLRGAIAWSYDLLDPPASRLFEHLSVFVGGFDLDGAEAIGADSETDADPIDTLAALVDQSLLQSGEANGEPRFTFLEPIREFAVERLEATSEAATLRERHARWFLDLAVVVEPELNGDHQRAALDRLEREHANLRAAMDWADAHGDGEVALGIATRIWRLWQKRGHLAEAKVRMTALLAAPWFPSAPLALRARAIEVMAGIIYWHGDFAGSRGPYEAALAAWRETGDRSEIANSLYNLSFSYAMDLQSDEAGGRQAAALLNEALATYRELGDERGQANVLWGIGIRHYFAADNAAAAVAFEAALAKARQVGDRTLEAWAQHQLGSAKLKLGDYDGARESLPAGLALFDEAGDVAGVTLGLDDLAALAVVAGDLPRAARLQGLARRLQADSGTGLGRVVDEAFERASRPNAANRLEPEELERYRAEGATLALEDGVRYALGRTTWEELAHVSGPLPTGTVTLLFTDIEGSTRLLARVGDAAYGALLDEERVIVTDAVDGEGGVVFGSEGDAHFAAFPSAGAAVRAAVVAQRSLAAHAWPAGEVRVRMGLHSGEVQVANGDYHGLEVHRAARVAAVAHGGQVLVSAATRALAAGGDGIGFRDLGEHRLKDIERAERLFQVEATGLGADFPPPRAVDAGPPGNLPTALTSFVGRAEVDRASALLERSRLLTLTGPGGTGKTRLSIQLADASRARFPDGAWFVPLASVSDPELIASAIAASIGLLATDRMPIEVVREHLASRRVLLVLDNFEQVVEGAGIVADLLRSAPTLTVIASSRAPLRIAGEQEFPVPPLALPPEGSTSVDEIGASEAVRLFVERAMAVRPDFALTADNATDVSEIVRRLDGLPLAIELAAARIRLLGASGIARRLDDRLGLLSSGGRDLPERQRTLRGAIEWSHDLLDEDTRRTFARLSAFARGGPVDLAEMVCALPGDAGQPVLDGLEQLAEQSLVRIGDDAHGDLRFTMLETIHEYASERLAAAGERDALRGRHADALLALATEPPPPDGGRGPWLDRMEDEHDNLRGAFDYLVETGDHERVTRLVEGAWRFWHMRGHVLEGRRRVDRVLAMPGFPDGASGARLRALEAAGGLAYWSGDLSAAGTWYTEAEAEARRLGDQGSIANALYNRYFARGGMDTPEAWRAGLTTERELLDEAIEIWTGLGDELGVARGLWGLGEYHTYRDEFPEAEVVLTRALDVFERHHDQFWIAWALFTRGITRLPRGNLPSAAGDFAGALRAFRAAGDVSGLVLGMAALSSALLASGREEAAYQVGAAADRAVSETGLRLALLGPTPDGEPFPDRNTTDPRLQAAAAEGRAWTRAEALDRSVALAEEIMGDPPSAARLAVPIVPVGPARDADPAPTEG